MAHPRKGIHLFSIIYPDSASQLGPAAKVKSTCFTGCQDNRGNDEIDPSYFIIIITWTYNSDPTKQ